MHRVALALVLAAVALAGCAYDDLESDELEQGIVDGEVSVGFPGVVLIGNRCTGTLIAPRLVLTAAHCGIGPGDRALIMNIDTPESAHRVTAVHDHRLYSEEGGVARADITVALLADAPSAAPFGYPTDLEPSLLGQQVTGVGFGHSIPDDGGGFGTKREADFAIDYVNEEILQGDGVAGESVCSGDSGGPAFSGAGGEMRVVGVARSVFSGCRDNSTWTRVDAYAAGFIIPAMDALDGPCRFDGNCVTDGCRTPDPDCGPCGLDGICSSGCEVIDLDCPPKAGYNAACSSDDDCESLLCVERDSGEGQFCTRECGAGAPCPDQSDCESRPEGDICVPRTVIVDDDPGGCGCDSSRGGGGGALLVLLALGWLTRRRVRRAW